MSYPLTLQPLVIEDDEGAKDAYKGIFEAIAADYGDLPFAPAPPCFAFSYEEAKEYLDGSKIFHVVILDLRLPEKPKLPPIDGTELGLKLLTLCVDRDHYPIPALLVISGHIGSTEQTRMQETVRQGFYYGRAFVKTYEGLEDEIRRACTAALRYCSVGVHLRDAGDQQCPTITPREEDLLRRSVLQQQGGIGLDLNWWSAQQFHRDIEGHGTAANPWTKVLMGRYLLDGGRGASRPKFFKLLAGSDAQFVIESARHLEQKLNHVKLTSTVAAKSNALIVTEKVGAQDARPKSLEEFLGRARPEQAFDIARQITNQVQQLGDLLPESRPLKTILWPAHDRTLLSEQWNQFGPEIQQQIGSNVDPISLYSELVACEDKLRVKERSLVHGDLHIRNVALDIDGDKAAAYIFDPGVIKRSVAGRDLAVLEVSVVLHQRIDFDTLSQICSVLYGSDPPVKESVGSIVNPVGKNIVEFIRGLRDAARAWNDPDVYALMVFDFALIQVGGLAFGSSGNKIWDQRSAVYLLAVVADWYLRLRQPSQDRGET
ncbi:MAG: phosphotransferase [Acidobacteriia bacterium]|nr:phosphotransferase [Terriglobia bacterium]